MNQTSIINGIEKCTAVLLSSLVMIGTVLSSPSSAADDAISSQLYAQANEGVVTVFTSTNEGAGFLIDDAGLILTTSQNIQDAGKYVSVKFKSGETVKALVVVNDRERDVAVLRVNLQNVQKHHALELSPDREHSISVGDQVYAVGGLAEGQSTNQPVAASSVTEMDKDLISVNSPINSAYLGGPMLNKAGQVVGINTIGTGIPAFSAAVPISHVTTIIEQAKARTAKSDAPAADLLPSAPETPYQIGELTKENPDVFKDRNHKDYTFDAGYFSVCVLTPPEGQNRLNQVEEDASKEDDKVKEKKKSKKEVAEEDEEQQAYMTSNYYKKPVVTLLVIPRPKLATDSKKMSAAKLIGGAAVGFGAGLLGPAGIPILVTSLAVDRIHDQRGVKKDFLQLALVDSNNKPIAQPISFGKAPFTKATMKLTGCNYSELIGKSFMGVYTFDAHAFETTESLKLSIDVDGKKKKTEFAFPDNVKKLIVDDFKPYWEYIAKTNNKKESQM